MKIAESKSVKRILPSKISVYIHMNAHTLAFICLEKFSQDSPEILLVVVSEA